MSKTEVRLNTTEVGNLLKSQEVMQVLEEQADAIIERASGNYVKSPFVGKRRVNVTIMTNDSDTYHHNLKDNQLLKALGGKG